MNHYYRIIIDFSHNTGNAQEFEAFFDKIVGNLMEVLDPHEGGETECAREVWVLGKNVTAEYTEFHEESVQGFRQELDDPNVVGAFLEGLHFKDYPKPREDD